MQVMLINVLVFVSLLLIKKALVLAVYEVYYQALYQYLGLPASWEACLHQPWSMVTHFGVHEHFFGTIGSLLLLICFWTGNHEFLG